MKGCSDGTAVQLSPQTSLWGTAPSFPHCPGALGRFVAWGLTGCMSLHFDLRVHPP